MLANRPWERPPRPSQSSSCATCNAVASAPDGRAAAGPAPLAQELAAGPVENQTAAYAASIRKVMCPRDKAFLADLQKRGVVLKVYDRIYFDDPYYDGKRWTVKRFEAGGTQHPGIIQIVRTGRPSEDAHAIYHEGIHTRQREDMPWREREYEAHVETERWRVARGLPASMPGYQRQWMGRAVVDEAAIRSNVDSVYPGVTVASEPASGPTPSPAPSAADPVPAAPAQIIGRTARGLTRLQRADGSIYERAPRAGDSYPGPQVREPKDGLALDLSELQCR